MSNSPTRLEVVESITDIGARDVAVSPVDGTIWAGRSGNAMYLRAGDAPREIKPAGFGRGVRFSPDGSRIHAGLEVFDTATGNWARAPSDGFAFYPGLSDEAHEEAKGYVEGLSAACFEPTTYVVAAEWRIPRDGSIDKPTAAPAIRLIAFDEQLRHIADLTADLGRSPLLTAVDCSKRWVVATAPRAIVWEHTNGYKRVTSAGTELPGGNAISIRPDDRAFALVGGTLEPEGSVTIVDPATGKTIARAETGLGTLSAVAFSRDGTRLAAGGDDDVVVLTFDGTKLAVLATAKIDGPVTGVAFEPDGTAVRAVGRGAYRLVLR